MESVPAQDPSRQYAPTAVLGDVAMRIEHVGSTSVPGLAAKPILDIDVVIESREKLPAAIERLATLGYEHEGDHNVAGREAFRPGEGTTPRTWPAHHLYVCAQDNRELLRHLRVSGLASRSRGGACSLRRPQAPLGTDLPRRPRCLL